MIDAIRVAYCGANVQSIPHEMVAYAPFTGKISRVTGGLRTQEI
jgi:hypothetical protein